MQYEPFTDDQVNQVKEKLLELKFFLELYELKVQEEAWTNIYTDVKGLRQSNFSNQTFNDVIEDGIGVEIKKTKKADPRTIEEGDRFMHPSLTRAVTPPDGGFSSDKEEKEYFIDGLQGLMEEWEKEVETTLDPESEEADLRWGILLHTDDLSHWAYWETEAEFPGSPDNYYAERNQKDNLNIYPKGTSSAHEKPKYTITKTDHKIEGYFTIPPEEDRYHFKLEGEVKKPENGSAFVELRVAPGVYEDFKQVVSRQTEDEMQNDTERLKYLVDEIRRQKSLSDF